jgi:hypothetical protein
MRHSSPAGQIYLCGNTASLSKGDAVWHRHERPKQLLTRLVSM